MNLETTKEILFSEKLQDSDAQSNKFSNELRNKLAAIRREREDKYFPDEKFEEDGLLRDKVQEIAEFAQDHIQKVGEEQAVKDFQLGFNLLNKGTADSILPERQPLEEDGDFGEKTFATLTHLCKYYTPRVIMKYLRKGALTNAVFETKNDSEINTDELVCEICNNLNLGRPQ